MYVLPIKEQDYTELLDSFKHILLILASVKSYSLHCQGEIGSEMVSSLSSGLQWPSQDLNLLKGRRWHQVMV